MIKGLLIAAICLAPGAAPAFTLDGQITGGTAKGAFVKLDPATSVTIGADTFENDNLYALDEDQNIVLPEAIRVDIGAAGPVIPKGTTVASHYVFFDPGYGTSQIGYVEFDAPILGVATSTGTMQATDFLANTQVTYLNPYLRGLEWEDAVWIDPDNPFRIIVRWIASSPGDYIRVFTARSPGV